MLTKIDVQALRKCDDVSFHYYKGETYISATKRANVDEAFSTERKHRIDVGQRVEMFGESPWHKEIESAFAMIHCAYVTPEWTTFAALAKEGDDVKLVWSADGARNGYMTKAGLHGDTLSIEIHRNGKILTFKLLSCTCENNSARMVQLRTKPEYRPAYEITEFGPPLDSLLPPIDSLTSP